MNTESHKPEIVTKDSLWTISCPDQYCRSELPFSDWIERGFFRCPKCGILCCLLNTGKTVELRSMGVYVRW